mgnify:FL=1|jgi:hypothetical protein|tara:strand:+ start:76 stop:273 length:198 start_codon:yes stop_codon:yes gene_type:complete
MLKYTKIELKTLFENTQIIEREILDFISEEGESLDPKVADLLDSIRWKSDEIKEVTKSLIMESAQ